MLRSKYPVKVRAVLGPGSEDDHEGEILNRRVRWVDGEVTFGADPKHVEKMLQDMRLAECNPGLVPGAKDGTVFVERPSS